MAEGAGERAGPIFRDIRRYYCDYCGICRSKKSLITSHILTFHKVIPPSDSYSIPVITFFLNGSDGGSYCCVSCSFDFSRVASDLSECAFLVRMRWKRRRYRVNREKVARGRSRILVKNAVRHLGNQLI